jgi:type I restriction enzyme M protein
MTKVKPFNEQVRELRSKLNLSQEQLAARLNISFQTVNRWESGKVAPQKALLGAVQKLLDEAGLSHDDLREEPSTEAPTRRRRGVAKSAVLSNKGMEQMLWDAACDIRGEKDAPKFKDYILPLLFIKRLSDVFDDEIQRLSETYGDRKTALEILEDDHSLVRFYIPPEARWPVVSNREPFKWPKGKEPKSLGEQLTTTIRAIVKHNPSLAGVIDIVDYNETRNGEREISDAALRGVIETFSDPRYRLGLHDVKPDFLGDCYEYLLRKFAEGQGQSAGEFFTPMEIGFLMAHILRPRPGEECYDYACGSFGLLIKLQLVSRMIDPLSKVPLKLYGQELTGSSYAIACMNKIIHDMEGQIVRGDSMRNPKFKDGDTRLRKFDIAVANPMWNQPFDSDVFENDPFERFEEQGGVTSGRGDWAWLQHTLACLKDTGRAAVVLDTGAVTRGSGSKNEDKERNIRKWFVEHDLVDGVILLPDNLFYNTTAAGIIIVLRNNKPKDRQGKIVLVNASQQFRKGTPKNYLPEEAVTKIADAFLKAKPQDALVSVITNEEAAKNDFNLSPSRYLASNGDSEVKDLVTAIAHYETALKDEATITKQVNKVVDQIKALAIRTKEK